MTEFGRAFVWQQWVSFSSIIPPSVVLDFPHILPEMYSSQSFPHVSFSLVSTLQRAGHLAPGGSLCCCALLLSSQFAHSHCSGCRHWSSQWFDGSMCHPNPEQCSSNLTWGAFIQLLSWLCCCGWEMDFTWVLISEPSRKGANLSKVTAHKQNKYISGCFLKASVTLEALYGYLCCNLPLKAGLCVCKES